MKKLLIILMLLIVPQFIYSQNSIPQPTKASQRFEAFKQKQKLQQNSLLKNVKLRSIGPSIMSGRVVDIDVSPVDPTNFYVAYATGGLWITRDNGISFTPLFDNEVSMTIGDIAVDWNHGETIWIGTGENNSSRSSYAGTGIYKSNDKGKTWQYTGLAETQHIGRIIISPDDPNTVWVAALGHLYSPNKERGVYKTTDGGKTWKQTLFIDDNTGAIDLVIDPNNTNVLYAAIWHRIRRAWNFVESGKTSGIYKSKDGGETWELLTTKQSGFPTGNGVGRIGLAVYKNNPQIIYAIVDNQDHRAKKEGKEKPAITKEMLKNISVKDFLNLNEDDLNNFLDTKDFPRKYSAAKIFDMVRKGKIKPKALVDYLTDANRNLFNTPVIGAEVYRSDDAGKTWKKTNKDYLDDLFYTYGYYFGEIRVEPNNDKSVYIMGVPALHSVDGGKTFKTIGGKNVHGDFHALWLDPNKDGHLIIGNDGGINITYDNGKHWFKANTPAVGQFYSVTVDNEKPYNVYGGLQDNGVWYGPSTYTPNNRWYSTGQYPFKFILGGDGMQVKVDTTDNKTVYAGFQFGYYYRVNKITRKTVPIKPMPELGEKALRFNWQSPIHLSNHNPDIFYIGSNKLHRSLNKGNDYKTISFDLTKGGRKGDVPYGTLTTIDESPLQFGLLYTGSDDGLVYVSKDGGAKWENISKGLPENLWISRVTASSHKLSGIYVSLNGYRLDDFNSYLYSSDDYGKNWKKIGLDLPAEPINVVKEDPYNKNILYVGTDHGLYVSLDRGASFMGLFNGMPAVPVHDLAIQKREKDLVVGTHGRSIYIADIKYIEALNKNVLNSTVHLFPLKNKKFSERWGNKYYTWANVNEPEMKITYYAKEKGIADITIKTNKGLELADIKDTSEIGLNFVSYDLSIDKGNVGEYKDYVNSKKKKVKFKTTDNKKTYLHPGNYLIEVEIDGKISSQKFKIRKPVKRKRG
ncbi:MAG TPA: glycosyl hydrolase [Ignavibacteria bacterium]|nr:glycosyl hydrolase [Ignavibacteria bacterium]